MTMKDLIEKVRVAGAHATGKRVDTVTKKEAGEWLAAVAQVVHEAIKAGEEVPLPGIGKIGVKVKAARTGRNPATGEAIQIPEKLAITFKPSKDLKEAAEG